METDYDNLMGTIFLSETESETDSQSDERRRRFKLKGSFGREGSAPPTLPVLAVLDLRL